MQCAVSSEDVQLRHRIEAHAAVADINSEFNLLNANRRRFCATISNNQKADMEAAMRQFMMTVMALAAFGAMAATAQAENQTPSPPTVSRPVTIYARVNGYVAKLIADIGDRVKKDQLLATIDTPILDAQLEAAQAQLNASETEVKVKEAVVDFAKTANDRWQGSHRGLVSDQEREDKKARCYAMAIAQLKAACARVTLDRANVDRFSFLTSYKQVTAPFEGVITDRRVDIGDRVTAGSSTNTTPLYGIAGGGAAGFTVRVAPPAVEP
jgi:multidrug efflux pump subunit AcrA (membrane-fusion protein)